MSGNAMRKGKRRRKRRRRQEKRKMSDELMNEWKWSSSRRNSRIEIYEKRSTDYTGP